MIQLLRDLQDLDYPYCLRDSQDGLRTYWCATIERLFDGRDFDSRMNPEIVFEILAEAPTVEELYKEIEELLI